MKIPRGYDDDDGEEESMVSDLATENAVRVADKVFDIIKLYNVVDGIVGCFMAAANATYIPKGEERRPLNLEELTEVLTVVVATRDRILAKKEK